MADDIQKPFMAKVADGIGSVGSKIYDTADNYLANRDKNIQSLNGLSDEDIALATYDPAGFEYKRAQQAAAPVGVLNAQFPTPVPLTDKQVNSSLLDTEDAIANASGGLLEAAAINQGALDNKSPIDEANQMRARNGTEIVPAAAEGTASLVKNPNGIPTAEQAQIGAQSTVSNIVNPYAAGMALQQAGINSAAKAGHEAAAAEHAFQKSAEALQLEDVAKQQDLKVKFDLDYQEKMDGLEQSMKDMKDLAGEKVIPGAVLARQDTSSSLMTGLAVALGGIGGALQGTNKNIGLDMINKAIDRDVAAQEFNLNYKFKVGAADVANQTSLLAKMREKFGDDKSALAATKLTMLDAVQRKMNAELTKQGGSRDTAVTAQQQMASGALAERRATIEMQLKAAQELAFREQQSQMDLGGDRSKWTDYQISYYEKTTGDKSLRDRFVPNFGPATNKFAAEEFSKFNSEIGPALDGISRLNKLSEESNKVTDWGARRKIEAERQALIGKLRVPFTGPGILNDAERAALSAVIGDPNKLLSFKGLEQASLRQVETILRDSQARRIREAGFDVRPSASDKLIPYK